MVNIGIDVGTDSVRLCVLCEYEPRILERLLTRNLEGPKCTMSSEHMWSQIMDMLRAVEGDFNHSICPTETELHGNLDIHNETCGLTGNTTSGELKNPTEATNVGSLDNSTPIHSPDFALQNVAPNSSAAQCNLPRTSPPDSNKLPRHTLCVAATCSMVVMERIEINNKKFYRPIDPNNEVLVWMDRRAQGEAQALSRQLPPEALAQIGGAVTPEMGIAKLLWVSKKFPHAVVFELYDWVSYLFIAGGYVNGLVECLDNDVPKFPVGLTAMDGSVKGWSEKLLQELGITAEVACAPRKNREEQEKNVRNKHEKNKDAKDPTVKNFSCSIPGFEFVGVPLGGCQVAGFEDVVVCHGCIDCYSGPLGESKMKEKLKVKGNDTELCDPELNYTEGSQSVLSQRTCQPAVPLSQPNSGVGAKSLRGSTLSMVAGTLTCFIAEVTNSSVQPIPGLWGPFTQLSEKSVYSFGQPATGELFAALFAQYADVIGPADPFMFVEERALALFGPNLIIELARHFLYYGDLHGNRSPYGEFTMGQIYVDGTNGEGEDGKEEEKDRGEEEEKETPEVNEVEEEKLASEVLTEVLNVDARKSGCSFGLVFDHLEKSLILKYYLILEFLTFQTKQLGDILQDHSGIVSEVSIGGSQGSNHRFVRLLDRFAFPHAKLKRARNGKFSGVQGAAVMGKQDVDDKVNAPALAAGDIFTEKLSARELKVLQVKYKYWHELSEWQASFRKAMRNL